MNEINIISSGAPDRRNKPIRHRRRQEGSRRQDRIIAASWTGLGFVIGFLVAGVLYLEVAMM